MSWWDFMSLLLDAIDGVRGYMPTLLGLSVMLPALFGTVLVRHPYVLAHPPASLDWAWACLRWLARSR
jgi:hypothetical protein